MLLTLFCYIIGFQGYGDQSQVGGGGYMSPGFGTPKAGQEKKVLYPPIRYNQYFLICTILECALVVATRHSSFKAK